MGLDQFARATTFIPDQPVDFESHEGDEEIFYWRKHPNLHGWMEELYRARGGEDIDFNVSKVALTAEDLNRLWLDVTNDRLRFFFGTSLPEDRAQDLEFIEKARASLAEGKCVYYTSWW